MKQLLPLFLLLIADHKADATQLNILDFGAVPNDQSVRASLKNAQAIVQAFATANKSASDNTVLIPTRQKFYSLNIELKQLKSVNLKINGQLFCAPMNVWQEYFGKNSSFPGACLHVTDSMDFTITGNGRKL